MLSIDEHVFLKANWNDTRFEVYVTSFQQTVTRDSNVIEMYFHCVNNSMNYIYNWSIDPTRGTVWITDSNKKPIDDPLMEEIARQLSIWFRQTSVQRTPIITY